MNYKWEIILAGYGGQGLGRAGQILAEAAIIYDNLKVAHNQSYGARARGGSSQSSLIISSDEITFPIVEQADILVVLSSQSYPVYEPQVNPEGGVLIYDSSIDLDLRGRVEELGFPFSEETKKLEHPAGISIIALGVILKMFNIISPEALIKTLEYQFSGSILDMNIRAFQIGQSLANS